MNELQIFENPDFGEIRVTINEDGEPLFVAADVCRVLDVQNHKDAIKRLDADEKLGVVLNDPHGRPQETNCVTESGLYSLVLGSRKKEAKAFKRWVTHEVIPSIRKHGAYMTPQTLEQALLSPDFLMQLAQRLKEEQQARKEAEYNAHLLDLDNRRMQPKADYFDALVEKNLLTSFRETAKMFHVEEKDMIRFLLDNRYLYRSQSGKLLPYATRPDNGLFEVKEAYDPKSGWRGIQTYVTPRGRETLRLLLEGKPESGLWGFRPPDPPEEMTEAEGIRVERYLTEQARKKRRKQNK